MSRLKTFSNVLIFHFFSAKYFNQDLSNWNVDNVDSCDSFNEKAESWQLPRPNFLNCDPD